MPRPEENLRKLIRERFLLFLKASFYELNSDTPLSMNWHIEKMAEALEDCFYGRTKRLIINIPPRSLKSHSASTAFPAWIFGMRPGAEVICASYSQDLSDKLARECRSLMQTRFYTNLFTTRLSSSKPAVNDFTTTHGGTRLSTSVGGSMTGRGADFIIVDDPLKPDEALSDLRRNSVNDWFENTVVSRLNDKETGCIIVIMQRLHQDDLTGRLLSKGEWRHLRFPAIAEQDEVHTIARPFFCKGVIRRKEGEALHPERESLELLSHIRASMSSYDFAGQYQQAPAPLGGGMVKTAWFRTYKESDLPSFDSVFQSWDTANTINELSDYSVCTTWGTKDSRFYLLHVFRDRLEYPDLKRRVLSQARDFRARKVVIEDKASGTQLIQELKRAGMSGVTGYKSMLDKKMRMNSVTSTIENGLVYLPESAAWLNDFLSELNVFPYGRHDDQADSLSQALDWFESKKSALTSGLGIFLARQIEQRERDSTSAGCQNPWDH